MDTLKYRNLFPVLVNTMAENENNTIKATPFSINDREYQTLSQLGDDILADLRSGKGHLDTWRTMLKSGALSVYMADKKSEYPDLARDIHFMEASERDNPNDAGFEKKCYQLAYLLGARNSMIINEIEYDSIDGLANEMAETARKSFSDYINLCKKLIRADRSLDPQFEAWLTANGKLNIVNEWKRG